MKTNRTIAGWLMLLALSTFNLQLSTAFAATNRVGMLTATYSMECSGSGSINYYVEHYGTEIEEDDLSISASGSAQYEVLQTETNLLLGNLITSTLQIDASGNGSETYIYPSGNTDVTTWSWHPDWTKQETNNLYLGWYFGTIPSKYTVRCLPTVTWDVSGDFNPNIQEGFTAAYDTWTVTGVDFYLTNSARPWSQTLFATGGITNDVGPPGVDSGSEVLTVSLQYVPDQLNVPFVPFTADLTNGLVPLTVHFSAASVDSGDNSIVSWNWSFGDGTNGTGQYPVHTYTTKGTFSVTLVATNVNGMAVQGIGFSNITVSLPTVQFTVWPTNGFRPLTVNFTCPAVDSADNSIVSWNWDFGDNTSFADQSPDQPVSVNHIYTQIKTFSPKLTVTNIWGTRITTNGPKVVVSPPPIFFTASPINSLVPMRVQFGGPGGQPELRHYQLELGFRRRLNRFGAKSAAHLYPHLHFFTDAGGNEHSRRRHCCFWPEDLGGLFGSLWFRRRRRGV
jgi:PKD repeat protein